MYSGVQTLFDIISQGRFKISRISLTISTKNIKSEKAHRITDTAEMKHTFHYRSLKNSTKTEIAQVLGDVSGTL